MPIELKGATSGGITLTATSVAGANTITLPAATGTAVVNGANSSVVSASSQASTSGTSIDFTNIPSWVKRITFMLQGVSTNGTSLPLLQIGTSSGVETSSYLGTSSSFSGSPAPSNHSSGFLLLTQAGAATNVLHGILTIANISGNAWTCSGVIGASNSTIIGMVGGSKSLSGTLDRVRLTTVNGTDAFDAGTVNILYE